MAGDIQSLRRHQAGARWRRRSTPPRCRRGRRTSEPERRQRGAFDYFLHESNDANGLVRDKSCPDWPARIAAVALGLTGTEGVHKLYTESFTGRDHLSGIQEEAQAIIRRVLRAGGRS